MSTRIKYIVLATMMMVSSLHVQALTDIGGNFTGWAAGAPSLPADIDLRLTNSANIGWQVPSNLNKNFNVNGFKLAFELGWNDRGTFTGVYSGTGNITFEGLRNDRIPMWLGGPNNSTFSGTFTIKANWFGVGRDNNVLFTSGPIILGSTGAAQLYFRMNNSVSAASSLTSSNDNNVVLLQKTSQVFGSLILPKKLTIDMGGAANTLRFGDSSAETWGASTTLTIKNYIFGSSKVYFGNSSTALTSSQLSSTKIQVEGFNFSTALASDGELVFAPQSDVPGAFNLISPTNNATIFAMPTFYWQRPSNQLVYDVNLISGTTTQKIGFADSTNWTYAVHFPPSTTYTWNIVATNSQGTTPSTDSFTFTTSTDFYNGYPLPAGSYTANTDLPLNAATNKYVCLGNVSLGWQFTGSYNFFVNGYRLTMTDGGNPRTYSGFYAGTGEIYITNMGNFSTTFGGTVDNTFSGKFTLQSANINVGGTANKRFTSGPIQLGDTTKSCLKFTASGKTSTDSSLTFKVTDSILYLNGTTQSLGGLILQANGSIELGTGGSVSFADSSSQTWTAGRKLLIRGWTTTCGMKFGTSDTALTASQLSQVKIVSGTSELSTALASDGTLILAPPASPATPTPADDALNVSVMPTLIWSSSPGASTYSTYLWKTSETEPATPTVTGLTSPTYALLSQLQNSTEYSWKVVVYNASTNTIGPVWSFTTEAPDPRKPSGPSPFNGETGVLPSKVLTWNAAQDAVNYKVYLWLSGASKPGSPTATVTTPSYTPSSDLQDYTNWVWQVVAVDGSNVETSGDEWAFSTARTVTGLTFQWNGNGGTAYWTDIGNWVTGQYPAIPNDRVEVISNSSTPSRDIELTQNTTITSLKFLQPTLDNFNLKGGIYTLGIANGGSIDLNTSSLAGNNRVPIVSAAIAFSGDATLANYWSGGQGCRLLFSGSFSGNGTLYIRGAKSAPGYWGVSLENNNTNFFGSICMTNNSALRILNNSTVANVSKFEIGAGIVQFLSSTYTFPAGLDVTASMDLNMRPGTVFSTPIRLTNSATMRVFFDANGVGTATISGRITGTGNLEVENSDTTGSCTLLLNGTNTYTGTTLVKTYRTLGGTTGVIPVNAKASTPTEVAPIVVQGTLDLSGGLKLGFVNASTTVVSSTPQVIVDYSAGTLNLGSKTMTDIATAEPRWELTNNTDEKKIYGKPWHPKGTLISFQ
jgi:hypothetical protein